MDKRVDLGVAVGFLAFGVWLLVSSYRIPQGSVPDTIGSGGVARVLAVAVIVLTAVVIARRLIRWRSTGVLVTAEGSADNPAHPASARRGLGMFGLLVAYAIGVYYLGYPIATPVFVALALWLMGIRSAMMLVALPIGYTLATYALFVGVFGVLLPLGVLSVWDYYLWFHF